MKRVGLLLLGLGAVFTLSLASYNFDYTLNVVGHGSTDGDALPDGIGYSSGFLPRIVLDLNSAGATTDARYAELIAEWREVNEDVIGYIDFPEFEIEYPVLQGETNKTYLRTNIYKEYDTGGCIFLDANYPDIYSPVKLIHGHYMKNKTMFGHVPELLFYETLDTVSSIFYTDDLGTKEFKVFAVFTVNSQEESVIITQFPLMEELEQYKEDYIERSWVPVSEVPTSTELLMLNTCWYGFSGKEHFLHCIVVAARV